MALKFLNDGFFDGKVGIGTDTPDTKLHVKGISSLEESTVGGGTQLRFVGVDSSTHFNFLIGKQFNKDDGFEITPSTTANGTTFTTPAILVKNDGKVGIGTISPNVKLDIKETTSDVAGEIIVGGLIDTDTDDVAFGKLNFANTNVANAQTNDILASIAGEKTDSSNRGELVFSTSDDAAPAERMRIDTSGAIKFNAYDSTNNTGTPTYLLGTDASGNVVKALSNNGLGFAPAINFIRSGITSTYTMIATVNGDGLSSIIQMSITGTGGSTVLNSLFDISVSHSQDIHVTSQSGDYTEVTLRITSNNNEDFSIEAKHDGPSAVNAEIWIYPKAGESVTPTTVDPNFSGSEYEHIATEGWRFGGEDNNVESSQVIIDDKLGIGTTSPDYKLHVNSTDASDDVTFIHHNNASQTSGNVLRILSDAGDNTGSGLLNIGNGTGKAMYVRGDRRVGIGTSSTDAGLSVKGLLSLALSGTVTISNSSNAVTGTNTAFLTELKIKDAIKIGAEIFTVSAIGSNTSLTLDSNVSIASTNVTAFIDPTLLSIRNGDNGVQVFVNKSGNVGIGTSSPTDLLALHNNATGAVDAQINFTTAATGQLDGNGFRVGWNGNVAQMYLFENADMRIGTNNVERIRILADGNVGIGATNPLAKLHVKETTSDVAGEIIVGGLIDTDTDDVAFGKLNFANINSANTQTNDILASIAGEKSDSSNRGELVFSTSNDAAPAERMRINYAGDVGIGTDDPTSKVHIEGANNATLLITRGGVNNVLLGDSGGNNGGDLLLYNSAGALKTLIRSDADSYLNGGNVGIGTSIPSEKLEVSGKVLIKSTAPFLDFSDTNSFTDVNDRFRIRAHTDNGQVQWYDNSTTLAKTIMEYKPSGDVLIPNGNVGIGTTTPKGKLHILDGTAATYTPNGESDTLVIESGVPGGVSLIGTGAGGNQKQSITFGTTADVDMARIIYDPNNSFLRIGTNVTNNYVVFSSGNNAEAMRIDINGNVGIGETNPNALLHVRAATDVTGTIEVQGGKAIVTAVGEVNSELNFGSNDASATGGIGGSIKSVTENTNGARVGMSFYTAKQGRTPVLEEAMRIDHDGNVGIGTTSPTQLLTLETDSSPGIKIKDTTQGVTLLAFSQDADSHIGTYSLHPLVLDTNSTERMRITSAGNVGIGETEPGEKLDVKGGNIRLVDASAGLIFTAPNGKLWKQTISNTGAPVYTDVSP